MDRTHVVVQAADPISQAGVVAQLGSHPDVRVVTPQMNGHGAVWLVVVDEVDDPALQRLRSVSRHGSPIVLVASRLDDASLIKAVEAGVVGIVRRCDATTEQLVGVIRAAARGDAAVPPDLLGKLLAQVGRLERHVLAPRGLTFAGLSQREVDVLRLVADGCDTAEIADRLAYSERTVKNVLHDVTSRLHLRNRSQAVAYAVREGLI
jgi:DNA-binding NarL/FixJ family response regulator